MNEVVQDIKLWIKCGEMAEKLNLTVEIYNQYFAVKREAANFLAFPKSLVELKSFLQGYGRGIRFVEDNL